MSEKFSVEATNATKVTSTKIEPTMYTALLNIISAYTNILKHKLCTECKSLSLCSYPSAVNITATDGTIIGYEVLDTVYNVSNEGIIQITVKYREPLDIADIQNASSTVMNEVKNIKTETTVTYINTVDGSSDIIISNFESAFMLYDEKIENIIINGHEVKDGWIEDIHRISYDDMMAILSLMGTMFSACY